MPTLAVSSPFKSPFNSLNAAPYPRNGRFRSGTALKIRESCRPHASGAGSGSCRRTRGVENLRVSHVQIILFFVSLSPLSPVPFFFPLATIPPAFCPFYNYKSPSLTVVLSRHQTCRDSTASRFNFYNADGTVPGHGRQVGLLSTISLYLLPRGFLQLPPLGCSLNFRM